MTYKTLRKKLLVALKNVDDALEIVNDASVKDIDNVFFRKLLSAEKTLNRLLDRLEEYAR